MSLKVYEPDQIVITLGTIILSGYADGTFISIDNNEDAFTLQMGTDGEGTRSKSNNQSATITFSLMQSSSVNALLSALHNTDINTAGGDGIVPLLVKDLQGNDLYTAEKAWIRKAPAVEYAREATVREWTVETEKLVRVDGGA